MTVADRDALTGAADRCCIVVCDYRVDAVAYYLSVIRHLEEAGEDVAEAAESALCRRGEGRGPGASGGDGASRYANLLIDVQQAAHALRAAGKEVTPGSVALRLCPWALDDPSTRGLQ